MCCYTKSPNNNDIRNDNAITVTETSDHHSAAFMNCLEKVIHRIKHMHETLHENVYVWSGGMGSQFRSR